MDTTRPTHTRTTRPTHTVRFCVRSIVAMVLLAGLLCAPAARAQSPEHFLVPSRYFEATGHNVGGPFLTFYTDHGGADIFGLPITEVIEEGRVLYQYFEYARLEIRPDQPDNVWISPLGTMLTYRRTEEPPFVRHEAGPQETSTYFPATGHNLSYQFRDYWERNGGHPVFGYPISEAFQEEQGGKSYTVQYFERARLAYRLEHPGDTPQIRHGNLGRDYATRLNIPADALQPARPLVVLGSSSVHFGTSSGEMQNIRLAARQFDGLKMQPGEEISFLALVGELSADTGYVKGGGIVGGTVGQVIAGGICWLSTAIFQSVYTAGMEILERHPHSLALNGFVDTPGLDSAVYTPDGRGVESSGDVDLRWRNDLPDPVLMTTSVLTTGVLMVSLWGYEDGRTVEMGEPVIQTSSYPGAPVWRYDDTLAPCEVHQLASGNPGMRITVSRVVTSQEGEELHHDSFSSRYAPLRGVYLYGPGVTPVQDGSENPHLVARERCLVSQHSQGASP